MPKPTPPPSPFATRRHFIQVGMAAVAAAWAGTLVQSRLFPQEGTQPAKPVSFPLAELPVGGVKTIAYGAAPALVMRTAEGIRAFSLICTHLACTVRWEDAKKEFFCPCHDGRFDQFGEVLAGPPPAPLEQVAVRVEGEQVVVGGEA